MIAALTEAVGLGSVVAPAPDAGKRPRVGSWVFAGVLVAVALLLAVFQPWSTQPRGEPRPPVASQQEDYRRAHELLTHYYRPGALETCIPLLEKIAAQDPRFAPALSDLGRANFLQFSQQRDTSISSPRATRRCARSPSRPTLRPRT
jgi:hypothetical protein